MGDGPNDFITQFHNLEGDSISERKRNFSKLLHKKNLFANEEELNVTVQNLQPKTYLESLFRIDMLIYFKRTSELLEILKEGNEVFVSKIIKESWFFKEAFNDFTPENLVTEFLPCMSYTIRMKILKRLTVVFNETQMDKTFDLLLKQYGLFMATYILHECSSTKIIEVLADHDAKLRPNQVKFIFDKDIHTFKIYLEHYKNITGRLYDETKVLKHIASKNPKLLLELKKNENLSVTRLGSRASKKIVSLIKDDITKNVEYYTDFLQRDVIVRKLQGNFRNVYLNLFPQKIEDLKSYNLFHQLLLYYPKKRQWDLFTRTFLEVYKGKNLLDSLNYFDYHLINMCPKKEIIQAWAEIHYNQRNGNEFLKYYDTTKAISLIKEKINVTSKMYDRLNLLYIMLDACEYNKDFDSLEKVLEYFCFRHRNEQTALRKRFLDHIASSFKLEVLTEKHWKYINEQIKIVRIRDGYTSRYNYYEKFVIKHLEFLFKNCKPFKEEIVQFVEDVISSRNSFCPNLENPLIEKEILIQVINVVPDIISHEHKDYKWVQLQLVSDVARFNKKNNHVINLIDFPVLINYIKFILNNITDLDTNKCDIVDSVLLYSCKFPQNIIEKEKIFEIISTKISKKKCVSYPLVNIIGDIITKKDRSEFENEILQFYFDTVVSKQANYVTILWFLKNEPLTLYPYFGKIVEGSSTIFQDPYRKKQLFEPLYFRQIKLYSHLNFDTTCIEFCKNQLNNVDCDNKQDIIKYLSYLLSTDDFIKFVEQYFLPKKEKLDLQDKDMQGTYKLQCEVAKVLKEVIEPSKMLPTVIKFCTGDYLQSALPSLYSIFYRSPQKQLYMYIDILSKKSVSVRKHAIFLSCAILDYNFSINILKTVDEKNISSQKHLFSATVKYFQKNPSRYLLDLIISNMLEIDKNDIETLNNLTSLLYKFPKKYHAAYIERCWQFYENLRRNDVKVDDYLRSLLTSITNSTYILLGLSSEFCRNIILHYFKEVKDNLFNTELFICNVLKFREVEQTDNFNFVFNIVSELKKNQEVKRIKRFFENFYNVASGETNNNFVRLFSENWNQLFSPVEMADEYILLQLFTLRCNSAEPFSENYARNVIIFFEQLMEQYTTLVYGKFKHLLKKILNISFKEKKDKLAFFYNVIKYKITPATCILVLDMMDTVGKYDDEDTVKTFHNILEILKNVEDPVVQMYFKSYVASTQWPLLTPSNVWTHDTQGWS